MKTVYVDTGVLVALLDHRDQYNYWIQGEISAIEGQLVTCESVLVETFYILKNSRKAIWALSGMINDDLLKLDSVLLNFPQDVFSLMVKYEDIHTSLADICLLSLYNKSENSFILTTDSDFHIYRDSKGKPLNLISPYSS